MIVIVLVFMVVLAVLAVNAAGVNGFAAAAAATIAYGPILVWVMRLLGNRSILGFVGDAARYLTPDPANIEARTRIRANALSLLRRLHEDGRYTRVVVVGHSLGSVIGYDVLRLLWDELREPTMDVVSPQPEAERCRDEIDEIEASDPSEPGAVHDYQVHQLKLWREQRALGTPWLVTDFITLGSPLAHAEMLLDESQDELLQRMAEYELPRCPPLTEGGRDDPHYKVTVAAGKVSLTHPWTFRIPNHGAVFASTRWTNIYFPYRRLIQGDIVGGPLQHVFGPGVRDVAVRYPGANSPIPKLNCHSKYWRPPEHEPADTASDDRQHVSDYPAKHDCVSALRSALSLDGWST